MSFRITTGNKKLLRIVACVLILCLLLVGCSSRTDSHKDDGTGGESVSGTVDETTGATETTSAVTNEETQSNTNPNGNTMPDEEFTTGDSVSDTESPEKPPDSFTVTIPASGNDETSATEPSTTPSDNTTTIPETEEDDMPDYGIELPDDNWD